MVVLPEEHPGYNAVQKDKRKSLRIPLIVEKIPCADGRRTFFGYARNLSRGGVFISTVSPRTPGEQFDLLMTLPASAGFSVKCRCEIVWQRLFARDSKHEPGMGLRFLDLNEETADALESWLFALPPQM